MIHTHTPGPWIATFSDMVRDASGRIIADCELTPFNERPKPANSQDIANARLIAAAPDLLAALEDAEFLLRKAGLMAGQMRDSFNSSASDARAAIAKATGKGAA